MSPQKEINFNHPTFEDAARRVALNKGQFFFFADKEGHILRGQVQEKGLNPQCSFDRFDSTCGYGGDLTPEMIWDTTEEGVEERLAQQEEAGASEEDEVSEETALVAPDDAETIITLGQRLDIMHKVGEPIVLNDKGGIDLGVHDLQATALDLTVRIAHSITAFGAKSMEVIVTEGIVNPILYRVLKKEFNALFDDIKALMASLDASKKLSEKIANGMRQNTYMAAATLTLQFLQDNAELIEFTQLAAVTNGDFAARALWAITQAKDMERNELPSEVLKLVEKYRSR
ncbi:MAG: hypothetical protein WC806_06530 [Candidatus Gracilibacteria bacterium]|jgi:hypothetical protein